MKTWFLWLIVFLVLAQAYITLQTYPEFHILTTNDYLKQLEDAKKLGEDAQFVGHIEQFEYFNGRYAQHLVSCTLIIDALMFPLLIIAIISCRRTAKNNTP
jgi:hypothetical protein